MDLPLILDPKLRTNLPRNQRRREQANNPRRTSKRSTISKRKKQVVLNRWLPPRLWASLVALRKKIRANLPYM